MQGLPYPGGSGISADLLLGKDAFGSYRRCSGKSTRNTQGVAVMTQRKGHRLLNVEPFKEDMLKKPARYRTKSLPAMGSMPAPEETQGEQMNFPSIGKRGIGTAVTAFAPAARVLAVRSVLSRGSVLAFRREG